MKPPAPAGGPPHAPPPPLHPGSLQRRLLLAALALVTVALLVAGLAIGLILQRFVRGQVDSRLDSQLVAIAGSLRSGPNESLRVARDLDGPPFDRDRAGWYWQVRQGDAVLRSASLESRDLQHPSPARPPGRERPYPADGTGPWGEALILRILELPLSPGAPPAFLVASAPAAALHGPLREAAGTLALVLGVLGVCLMGGLLAQVRLGLRPLERLRRDLGEVRAGRRPRVPGKQPAEIRPLVDELNALLDQNAANLEHARTHVANLAHGLKTPLATLALALSDRARDPDGGLSDLVGAMDRRVRHHLRRARTAALGGATRERTDLSPHVADLRTTFARLYAGKALTLDVTVPAGLAVACDGQDIDEMLGNLIDNACQWCRSHVRISARATEAGIAVTVEDDGPGLDAKASAEAIQRGRRLDETVPGNGFGLSITTELAELYGGGLDLDRSPLGGLRARLTLPS